MNDYEEILKCYNDAKQKTRFEFNPIVGFKVRENKVLDEQYMYETILKLKLITGKFSLPDIKKYSGFDLLKHSSEGNDPSYVSAHGTDGSEELKKMIDEMELPEPYKIRMDIPLAIVAFPLISIITLLLSVVLTSYVLTIVGLLLWLLSHKLKYESKYVEEVARINEIIDDDVNRMKLQLKEEIAYNEGIMPDDVDMNIDSMSYCQLMMVLEQN